MTSDPTEFDENDAELTEGSPAVEHSAVVFSTDWTAETLISQMRKGNIDLSPRFQRRDAWPRNRKSRFIESVILGLPIPQIVLAESSGQKGRFIVLDGKQRLLTLLQFWGEAPASPTNNAFKLSTLDFLDDLSGCTYADLQQDSTQLAALQNATIRTAIVRDWKSEAYLHLVFLRLNTGSLPLSPQELRLALTPGPFSEFVDQQAVGDKNLHELLGIDGPDPRMRDVELLVRFLAFQLFLTDYTGRLRPFLDESYKVLNRDWATRKASVEKLSQEFSAAIQALTEVFGEGVARKRGSRLFNRAIFDALVYFAADPAIRTAMLKKESATKTEYKKLTQDPDFISAVEKDTAGIPNTSLRLRMWGEALSRACKVPVKVPREKNGRIAP